MLCSVVCLCPQVGAVVRERERERERERSSHGTLEESSVTRMVAMERGELSVPLPWKVPRGGVQFWGRIESSYGFRESPSDERPFEMVRFPLKAFKRWGYSILILYRMWGRVRTCEKVLFAEASAGQLLKL